ncbi:glycoside hydrolase family 3 N-terminal domain-containing protein [Sphaerisporangium sp. TRM90804]|uniref:glycoside hydrolase family 3 protein n=1 Tax=Sphaerisporangium sp. TRM90804 TaxID=3031113 RepID=UPI002447AF3C|nr:glycoside hydrolase family 3 N-terminal domain-containing protein [Sphaerisporangium sp. TRM90804]MDH2427263.1 glycoside hydrolase family 3 N-terminal domain-containing protein [Sphaerisporangium sp. TRM90804]
MPHSPDLDRLAATVLQPGFDGTAPPDWLLRQLAAGLGGVVLFARNVSADTAALVGRLREENPRVIVAVDEEGGAVTRLEAATGSSWPGNAALGAVDEVGRTERTGREIGRMLDAAGITLDYAPDVDVNADPRNPVIGVRSFGAEAGLVARHAAAWITGLQSTGVAACAKHFPGHGDTVTDSHLALPTVHASRELLERRDLVPFRAAVDAGVRAVMCGHLMVPSVDPGRPATLSRRVLTGLLREELGFTGLAVTDAIEMRAVAARLPQPEIAVRALAAGADAVCVGASSPGGENVDELRRGVVQAVHQGTLDEARLSEAASRVDALATWHRTARSEAAGRPGGADLDPGYGVSRLGLDTARRALRVTTRGAVARPVLTRAPQVVEMTARPHQAIGGAALPYGPGAALAARLPGTRRTLLTPDGHEPPALDAAPLVLVTHDAHRHPWMRDTLERLLRLRPDAVVVETGLPGEPSGAVHLATSGSSRVAALAVAEWLTGR